MKRAVYLMRINVILAALFFIPTTVFSAELLGKQAPPFEVKSGDKDKLSLTNVQGQVIFMLYEDRNATEKNQALKDQISNFVVNQMDNPDLLRLPVINASQANMITSPVWRQRFREKSKEEGVTVYGDWSGKMIDDYGMKPNDSNVLLIDKTGVIRFFESGLMSQEQIDTIKSMLQTLAADT